IAARAESPEHVGLTGRPTGRFGEVVTLTGPMMFDPEPSTRTVTFFAAWAAVGARASRPEARRPPARRREVFCMEPFLSARTRMAWGRHQVSWLPGLPPRAFPARAA